MVFADDIVEIAETNSNSSEKAQAAQRMRGASLPCIPHQHPRRPDLGGIAPLARAAAGFGEGLVFAQSFSAGAALPVGAVAA